MEMEIASYTYAKWLIKWKDKIHESIGIRIFELPITIVLDAYRIL